MNDFLDGLAHRVFWALEHLCERTGHRYCAVIGRLNAWAFHRVTGC